MRAYTLLLLSACTAGKDGLTVYNTPPAVSITEPADGSSYDEGDLIEFRATVADSQDGSEDLPLTWTSDIDGTLESDGRPDTSGTATLATANLSPGNHAIRLQAVDSDGESAEDVVGIGIIDLEDAPEIAWIHPIPGQTGDEGVPFEFQVEAADIQDPPEDLVVVLSSSVDGEFCTVTLDGAGIGSCLADLSVNEHTLTATVTDTDANVASEDAHYEVIAGATTDDDGDGWTERQGDCDDTDEDIHPNAEEVDNDIDDDCDGIVDEGTPTFDDDGDGYTEVSGDCDDDDDGIYPGATEVCDGVDNDCDTIVDEDTVCSDDDGDGLTEVDGDCDDSSAFVYPGAPEVADGLDNDCDGYTDEGTDVFDDDGDCFCEDATTCSGSIEASCTSLGFDDCDDDDVDVSPGAVETCNLADDDCDGTVDEADAADASTWYEDGDGDGYGDSASFAVACSAPDGFVSADGDCDDADPAIRPLATELCDGDDNDCDGDVDEDDAADAEDWYADTDGDDFGDADESVTACDAPLGYVADDEDCDDLDPDVNPDGTEVCDGVDNDCDSDTDEADAADVTTWYQDADGDAYGNRAIYTISCSAPSGYVATSGDCDDDDANANPGEAEVCDSTDNDCDGSTDEGLTSTYYRDADGDSYGTSATTVTACSAPSGYVATSGDCNDSAATANPAATETCDSLDNDCDGTVDDGVTTTYYRDVDGDGYGTAATSIAACSAPSGYVVLSTDCDDASTDAYPGRAESCDAEDNDCDGSVDEGVTTTYYLDSDGDGYGTPATTSAACSAPSGYVTNNDDCNDSNSARNPDTVWYRDADGDGYGTSATTDIQCAQPTGYVSNDDDCDDSRSGVSPADAEVCDSSNRDEDCDGTGDEAGASGCTTYYYDYDDDGYGTATSSCLCEESGYYRATVSTDCYDYNSNARPTSSTTWYTVDRGDGDFDYNCDSAEEERYTNNGICNVDLFAGVCNRTAGMIYNESAPDCGDAGDYVTSCTYYVVYCDENTSSYTQGCR